MTKNPIKKFVWTWKAAGGPVLASEYRFHPDRKWRLDFAHAGAAVGIEIEGGIWMGGRHVHPIGFLADLEKYNEAALLGWTIFRLAPQQITIPYLERIVAFVDRRATRED